MPPNMPEKHFPVSWDEFHRDARALAWRLAAAGPFQVIVAITRGGLVPAGIVARELGVRVIETICVASYNHTTAGELRLLKPVADGILALGGPMVDTFITEVSQDTWIFFPWDTGLAFQPPIKEGGE